MIYRDGGVRFIGDKSPYPQGFPHKKRLFVGLFAVFFWGQGAHLVGRICHQRWGGAIYRDGDAGTVASSPRCRHEHDAQHCRNGITKGIEARRGRDLEQGSMRSTKARPRPRRGEPKVFSGSAAATP